MEHIVTSIRNVSWPECFVALKASANAYLIDVRTEEEWLETGIADLSELNKEVNLISWMILKPYNHINNEFLTKLMKITDDKQAELYFLCRSGGRSAQAAEAAMQAGYKNCCNLKDGFVENIARRKL